MIQNITTSGHTKYGLAELVFDTMEDFDDLPIDVPFGSSALCISTSSIFMLNSQGEWVEL